MTPTTTTCLLAALAAAGPVLATAACDRHPPTTTETTPTSVLIEQTAPPDRARAVIEVCFVLDTTGSMSGLIEGAKQKIWSIANEIIAFDPTPALRVGLVGYRDRGDAYVTRAVDLTGDIDAVYASLQAFEAGGGGDTPESVNQALHEAVTTMSWSDGEDVLKIIFLVGDAPPHMDYADDVPHPESCALAVRRSIFVNTVQCGTMSATTPVWRAIADAGEGSYVAIAQGGDMVVARAPMDDELAALNVELGGTIVGYGSGEQRERVAGKQAAAEAAAAPVAADRLAFNAATGRVVQGGGDLLDDLEAGAVTLEAIDDDDLPPALRELDHDGRVAFVEARRAERAAIQARIETLLAERAAWLKARAEERGDRDAFDARIVEILRGQASRRGLAP